MNRMKTSINELPIEVVFLIFEFLMINDIYSFSLVNKRFNDISHLFLEDWFNIFLLSFKRNQKYSHFFNYGVMFYTYKWDHYYYISEDFPDPINDEIFCKMLARYHFFRIRDEQCSDIGNFTILRDTAFPVAEEDMDFADIYIGLPIDSMLCWLLLIGPFRESALYPRSYVIKNYIIIDRYHSLNKMLALNRKKLKPFLQFIDGIRCVSYKPLRRKRKKRCSCIF